MGFKIKNSLTGEFEKLPILTLKGEKGETGGVEEYNKVDYMGNKYETLKQANDANVEYAVKTAIGEFNYLDYNGQHITATDTIEGQSKSAILTGQTLVNLSITPDTILSNGKELTMFNSMYKNNTLYTFIITTDKECEITYQFFNVNTAIVGHPITLAKGINKHIFTSPPTEFTRCILRNRSTDDVTFSNIMVIEGDYTQEDIPYFEGMSSVKMPVLTTTGKNLVDMSKFDSYSHDKGYIEIDTSKYSSSNNNDYNSIKVNLKPKTTYTVSVNYENTNYSNSQMHSIRIYDGDTKIGGKIISSNNTYYTYSFTTTGSTSYKVNITPFNGDTTGIYRYKNMQIEEGTQATSYEPYKSNILTANEDVELRGIGDVRDTLDLTTGELTERVREIVLDGSEKWTEVIRDDLSTPIYRITLSTNSNEQYNARHIRCNMFVANGYAWTDGEHIWIDNYNGLTVHTDRFNSLEDFKSYINNSNLIVQYTVNESVKTVDLSDNHVYSYKGTTYYDCSSTEGSLVPTLSVKVPTDVQATIAQQRETIQTLNSENERLNQIQEALKASMLDSQVQLMNLSWDIDFEVFTLRESIAPKDFLLDSRTGSNIDKFSQAKFIIENDCPDLEKLNSQIEYYFSKDVFSQEQFEELTDLISIVKGKMVVNIKSINVTTSKSNEEVMPKQGNYLYAAKTLTLAVSQDTNIFINGSVEPVLVKSKYGLSIPVDMKMTIGSIIVESENTEVYAVFAY